MKNQVQSYGTARKATSYGISIPQHMLVQVLIALLLLWLPPNRPGRQQMVAQVDLGSCLQEGDHMMDLPHWMVFPASGFSLVPL